MESSMATAEYRSVWTDRSIRIAKPRKGKGMTFNSSPRSIFNQSIISIHIMLIPLDRIGLLSILGYTNIACVDNSQQTKSHVSELSSVWQALRELEVRNFTKGYDCL